MLRMPQQSRHFSFLDKSELLKLKMKALRSGVWFKALRRIDRVLADLTSVAYNVHSITLAKCILAVTQKPHILFESELSRSLRSKDLIIYTFSPAFSSLKNHWSTQNSERQHSVQKESSA